jgi:hypothetical protein
MSQIKGIQPREIQSVLTALEQHKGDPAVYAKLLEMHSQLEEEYLKLKAEFPDSTGANISFEPVKQSLFEQVLEARKNIPRR